MSRPAAGPPSNTSITVSAARRTVGPRSTSSWQTCGPIGCKPSCAGVSIVSVETFGPGRVARRLALARHRVRHPGQGDRHQHAGRQARRRRPRLDRGVRVEFGIGRHRATGEESPPLCGRGQQRVRDWRANARAERHQRIPPAARICFSSSVQLMMTRSLPPLVPLRIMMNRPSGVTS